MLLKSKSSVAEKAAILANDGFGKEVVKSAQSLASSSAVSSGYLLIGFVVLITGAVALTIKFSKEEEKEEASRKINEVSLELIPIKVKS